MERVVKKTYLKSADSDLTYWLSKTDQERLDAIEFLRQQYIKFKYDAQPRFREFVELLIEKQVEYLIVGGYAVGVHGHPRYTGDLDIWLSPTAANASRVVKAIKEFGFGSLGLKEEDFTMEGAVIQLGNPPLRIDLLTAIDGVSFNECFQNKKVVEIDSLKVNFIGYQDLIKNKKASGRHRDLGDIESLSQ